jgi:hypothetical protein
MASENRTSNPRVTSAYLDSYVGKNVTVVGKLIQLRAEIAIIDADGNITAQLNRVCNNLTVHMTFICSCRHRKHISLQEMPFRSSAKSIKIFQLGY